MTMTMLFRDQNTCGVIISGLNKNFLCRAAEGGDGGWDVTLSFKEKRKKKPKIYSKSQTHNTYANTHAYTPHTLTHTHTHTHTHARAHTHAH